MSSASAAGVIRFGAFEFDAFTQELRKGRTRLRVPAQSLAILAMLLERPGGLVTREAIQARLWPHGTVVEFEHSVNAAVKRLREALSDTAATPHYIETLPKRGYRFIAVIEPARSAGAISHYRILSEAGRGAMGIVYRAEDPRLGREVAIKVLPPDLAFNPRRKARLIREARAASALHHPNIVTVHDVGSEGGCDYIVMEYVAGKPLGERIPRQGMPVEQAFPIALQIADALAKAHAGGIIHRDLKPGNIIVSEEDQVKLLDFGVAKFTEGLGPGEPQTSEGAVIGTMAYMSPEQAEGKPVDARSDIFSFGSLLYEMVTGRKAFERDSSAATLAAILHDEPAPPSGLARGIPPELEHIILRCLRKQPAERFPRMDDIKIALEELKERAGSRKPAPATSTATVPALPDGAPTAEAVREQLGRILASSGFRAAESVRRLLWFTVEAVLAGTGDSLKEYTIAVKALGRPESFDPHQDTIVRVQARKLRERLAAYYASEGASERFRIVYHPGSYLPKFTAAGEAAAKQPRTVAVLPFMNLTADESAGYFCDGLAEELIDLLARTQGLRVVARTSSFQFKGARADAREIGRRLGADLLIEGAVRGGEDRYRITARLLTAEDGCEIWAERYDSTAHDVLELETQIAASVASTLSSGIPPKGAVTDSEALSLFLRARYAWNQRTETGFRRALELYTAATRRDPRAAKAWAGIAECHVLMDMHSLGLPHVCMPKAREAALTALAIDPGLVSAWVALATVTSTFDREFEPAENMWRKALELDPAYARAHHGYAMIALLPSGRVSQAIEEIREAERLDPLSAPISCDTGVVLYFSRRFGEAEEQCRKTAALHPGFCRTLLLLARVFAAQGRYRESVETCTTARARLDGVTMLPHLLGILGFAHASSGNTEAARGVLGELHRLEGGCAATAYERAIVATALGDWDAAARELETAVEQRIGHAIWATVEPLLEALRARGILAEQPLT